MPRKAKRQRELLLNAFQARDAKTPRLTPITEASEAGRSRDTVDDFSIAEDSGHRSTRSVSTSTVATWKERFRR